MRGEGAPILATQYSLHPASGIPRPAQSTTIGAVQRNVPHSNTSVP